MKNIPGFQKRYLNLFASFLLLAVWSVSMTAQTDKELLARAVEENQTAVEALVMYPPQTRTDILEAALYPEALIKIEGMQGRTSEAFKKALGPFPRETQEAVWDLSRYPGLVRQLVRESGGTRAGLEKVVKNHPEAIRDRAVQAGLDHFALLQQIDALDQAAESAFASTIRSYPPQTQAALRRLLDLPEVLSLLTENLRLTILAGDMYRKEPAWTLRQADSLNLVIARRQAQETEAWKKSLDEQPQAREELAAAAEAYAGENGLDDDVYAQDDGDDVYYDEPSPRVVEHHYYHYPYWFGYPYWYEQPYWRPYPWWWDWGFYYGPHRTIIVIGLPSYHFMHWYFYDPWHHERWHYLSDHFVRHHHRHHGSGGSITAGVEQWRRRHGSIITEGWLQDDGRRAERFREFGRLEAARAKYNRENPEKAVDERTYLERNAARYPETARVKPPRAVIEQPVPRPRTKAPAPEPRVDEKPEPRMKPVQPPARKPDVRPQEPPARPPRATQPDLNKGREHHETTVQKEKTRERAEPRPAPPPRVEAPKPQQPAKKDKAGRKPGNR
jgi:hypothetical protein